MSMLVVLVVVFVCVVGGVGRCRCWLCWSLALFLFALGGVGWCRCWLCWSLALFSFAFLVVSVGVDVGCVGC